MAGAIITIANAICANAAGVVDIVMYPLLDINLAKALHNIINTFMYLFLQLPSVTIQRCYNNNHDLIMCLPDFEPVFNMFVAGLRNAGVLIDNWLDVSSIIVQKSFGLDPKAECDAQALLLSPASYSRAIFGNNRTVVVGLTPGLYAVTDGVHAQVRVCLDTYQKLDRFHHCPARTVSSSFLLASCSPVLQPLSRAHCSG